MLLGAELVGHESEAALADCLMSKFICWRSLLILQLSREDDITILSDGQPAVMVASEGYGQSKCVAHSQAAQCGGFHFCHIMGIKPLNSGQPFCCESDWQLLLRRSSVNKDVSIDRGQSSRTCYVLVTAGASRLAPSFTAHLPCLSILS